MQPGSNEARVQLRSSVIRELNRQGYRLRSQGFSRDGEDDKQFIRSCHTRQRKDRLLEELPFIKRRGIDLLDEFAEGPEVNPDRIEPELVPVVSETPDAELFRLATLLWSVPTSRGYGRRMRYLVRDRQNRKLLGLIALGDPVFNLSARDNWIGWSAAERQARLVHVMDAYILGAVPPYNYLLGGKLVAALATSREVCRAFRRKYGKSTGIITGEGKGAQLALLTTASALGRSSLYNRLELPCGVRFEKVGQTKGYGHFHLPVKIFQNLKQFMADRGHPYARGHRFGNGPNWRMRLLRVAFQELEIDQDILQHGIAREVYVSRLADNAVSFLRGDSRHLRRITWPISEIADYCKQRWVIPRAERDSRYISVTRATIAAQLTHGVGAVRRVFALNGVDANLQGERSDGARES
jgi:hypothetical protein